MKTGVVGRDQEWMTWHHVLEEFELYPVGHGEPVKSFKRVIASLYFTGVWEFIRQMEWEVFQLLAVQMSIVWDPIVETVAIKIKNRETD